MENRTLGLILGAIVGGGVAAVWLWRRHLAPPVQQPAEAPEQVVEGGQAVQQGQIGQAGEGGRTSSDGTAGRQ
ncbi:hypothetical protein GPALN_013099 [Globodera pallida]|nr:hypothetical protein GPALN_013099 [Globodera pallida]